MFCFLILFTCFSWPVADCADVFPVSTLADAFTDEALAFPFQSFVLLPLFLGFLPLRAAGTGVVDAFLHVILRHRYYQLLG